MSWEEMDKRSITCPCGKGVITRTDYMDDWNRYKETVSIDCPECRMKYKLVSGSYYKHPGDYGTVHYLLDADYPAYNGTKVAEVFHGVINIYQMPFEEYLIRTYTSESLQNALVELNSVTAVSRLSGTADKIAKEHKRAFKSAKISVLRDSVGVACLKYNTVSDNKDNRLPIEQKEQEERAAYDDEMRRHLIHISI